MLKDLKPHSDTLLPSLRVVDISRRILTVRGHRVIIDADLAEIYGVPTKALNQGVKRNSNRFPVDFAFRLTTEEKAELVTICDRFNRLKHSAATPLAFTEHGVIMAANGMNSPRAIEGSVQVVRTFVKMRQVMASHGGLAQRLSTLESKYDAKFHVVFDAIRALMKTPKTPRRRIGF
ncbi:ORF6N domain-containing protein [bacterium]|nr:ORF6N domain-containing protein [bacterium]